MHMPIIDLTLSNDAPTLGIVAPEFISTTIDWWTPSKDNGAWADSSVLTANLSSPKLIGAARALSPYFLRIGGSQAVSGLL
jgi:heparanase 1